MSSWAYARMPLCGVGNFVGHSQARMIGLSTFERKDQCRSALRTLSTRARLWTATRYRSQHDAPLHITKLSVTLQIYICPNTDNDACDRPEMPAPFQPPPIESAEWANPLHNIRIDWAAIQCFYRITSWERL